jgi:hypothetical protein
MKAELRSMTILLGTPKRWVISLMNFVASFGITLVTAQTSIHVVHLSIVTRMFL